MIVKSADVGAPTLSGESAKLYDVLKWALPQLGWSIEFDNGSDVIAFRNDPVEGTGNYLRIDDNPTNHDGNAKTANVTSFASMTDIDTGIDKVGTSAWLITKSRNASSSSRPWAVIGDDRYFWLVIDAGDDGKFNEYYFGDIEPDDPSDTGAFLTQANPETNPGTFDELTPIDGYGDGITGFSALRYNIDATAVGVSASYVGAFNSDGNSTDVAPGGSGTYPDPATGGIRVIDIQVKDPAGIRGRARGAVRALCDIYDVFANYSVILNQETSRGQRDLTVLNRWSRPTSPATEGALMFDTDHTGAW